MKLLFLCMLVLGLLLVCKAQTSEPLMCHDPSRVCSAYLYYTLSSNESKADVATIFNVGLKDLIPDPHNVDTANGSQGLYIRVNCSCFTSTYLANASFNATSTTTLSSIISEDYAHLAWSSNSSAQVFPGTNVSVNLLCGCLDNTREYGYLLSYVVQSQDSLAKLVSRFSSSISAIVSFNNITNENIIYKDQVYYFPINIAPLTAPVATPTASPSPPPNLASLSDISESSSIFPRRLVYGIVGGTCLLILIAIGAVLVARKVMLNRHAAFAEDKEINDKEFNWCLCECATLNCVEGACIKGSTDARKASRGSATISGEIMSSNITSERPIVYGYKDIFSATENFKESNMLGQGAFGTVYYGILHDLEVAIKRMKATINKEFLSEMKVLCKFHHTNLNELIGYSYYEDELFLVYEYCEHRSLADRLHEPISKGFTPLTWHTRVQIAVDTAKGLEYIHEHTKEHYVHRDVKSSNILLDSELRAKVADFGIAKLVEKTSGGEASVTRIVGTFGYLAPEYSRDGIATSKSDVYAFGVVLFELITGKEAISKNRISMPCTPERRSLITIMTRALKECPNPRQIGRLHELVDPTLNDLFPSDCLYKMAKLGQQCVEDDPILRPDMKYVVFTLSQILLSSIEWEATVAGNSQIFSGLIQGR